MLPYDKATNKAIDDMLVSLSERGATYYDIAGAVSSFLSTPLDSKENISHIRKTINNSKRRLKRKNIDITVVPAMFTKCNNPEAVNKAFIEMCEDIYFFIEQRVESLLDNYYEEGKPILVIQSDIMDRVGGAISSAYGRSEMVFEQNGKAISKAASKAGSKAGSKAVEIINATKGQAQ